MRFTYVFLCRVLDTPGQIFPHRTLVLPLGGGDIGGPLCADASGRQDRSSWRVAAPRAPAPAEATPPSSALLAGVGLRGLAR